MQPNSWSGHDFRPTVEILHLKWSQIHLLEKCQTISTDIEVLESLTSKIQLDSSSDCNSSSKIQVLLFKYVKLTRLGKIDKRDSTWETEQNTEIYWLFEAASFGYLIKFLIRLRFQSSKSEFLHQSGLTDSNWNLIFLTVLSPKKCLGNEKYATKILMFSSYIRQSYYKSI